ncbi:hypothetical protein HMPREF9372_3664, partial [Sporosarcina newyorkensis 2681]
GVPVFFTYGPNEYFSVGLAVSMVTVPVLFVVGVLSSLAIESFSKRKQLGMSYLKQLGCAIICAGVFSLTAFNLFSTALIVAFIYVTIFFIIDNVSKYLEIIKQKAIIQ